MGDTFEASSLKFLTVGDVHLADRPPESRKDDYRAAVLGKLRLIGTIAKKVGACVVLFTGDIFHIKKAIYNSHALVRDLIEVLNEYPCPRYAAPGNHDLKNDRMDSLPSQPLGVVYQSGALVQLTPEGHLHKGENLTIRFTATNYNEIDPLPECQAIKKGPEDLLVTVGHFYATPEGGPFQKHTCLSYRQLAATDTDIYVLGHFHMDQGAKTVDGKTFINLGSLTRGALDTDTLTRKVKIGHVTVYKDRTWVVKEVVLPVAPLDQVFDVQGHANRAAEKKAVEEFVESLDQEFSKAQGDASDPAAFLASINIPDRIKKEVFRRIEEASHG